MWRKILSDLGQIWRVLDKAGRQRPSAPAKPFRQKAGDMYGLNQWVRIKEYEICVAVMEKIQVRPYRISFDSPAYEAPDLLLDNGAVIVSASRDDWPHILFVNVAYRNPTTSKTIEARRNQWFLYDEEGYSYEAEGDNRFLYENNGKPFLGGTRYINPGLKARGWLAFAVTPTLIPERIQFVDGFLRGNTADFLLSQPPKLLQTSDG
jgi:hypothetical protein